MRGDKVVETSLPSDLKKPKMVKKDPMDVEMKDAESPPDEKEEPKKDADLLTLEGKALSIFVGIFVAVSLLHVLRSTY